MWSEKQQLRYSCANCINRWLHIASSYPTSDSLTSCNRVLEDHPGSSIDERISKIRTFQELGPPDLISLSKIVTGNAKGTEVSFPQRQGIVGYNTNAQQIGTYLYYTGLDNSSPSSVAAHLSHIANVISSKSQLWFGKTKNFIVNKATYCSYNAFSKVDVIVSCHLPGGIESFAINGNGEKVQDTDRIWTEVFASAMIRSLLTPEEDDEQVHNVVESRNINPLESTEAARLFLSAFTELFFQGPDVGCAPDIQTPSLISNYLVDAFLKLVELTGLYDEAIALLEGLREKEESVVSLIVKVLLLKDEEIEAVKVMYDGIKKNPRDAALLTCQSNFLIEKGKLDLALSSAVRAVNSAPSEFNTWANLSKVYLEKGQIEESLLTLNSCPMAAYKEKFHLKRVIHATPEKMHLPLPTDVHLEDVSSLDSLKVQQENASIDQALVNLQAANLKSTFAKAYSILTDIVHRTGWEQLLKYRAKIFVMEEEYQIKSSKSSVIDEPLTNGTLTNSEKKDGFKRKRLCERWLDNLFMLLYEDLRTYTMWQAEMIHLQAQSSSYEKLPAEWELLGMCAFRLHHYKEASIAFQKCLGMRFAPTATRNLLKYFLRESKTAKKLAINHKTVKPHQNGNGSVGNSTTTLAAESTPQQIERKLTILDDRIMDCTVHLTAWHHRWYREFSPYLMLSLADVVERQGLVKVTNEILAQFPEESGVGKLMADSFEFLKIFQKPGADI